MLLHCSFNVFMDTHMHTYTHTRTSFGEAEEKGRKSVLRTTKEVEIKEQTQQTNEAHDWFPLSSVELDYCWSALMNKGPQNTVLFNPVIWSWLYVKQNTWKQLKVRKSQV